LADIDQALRLKPGWTEAYGMKAEIYFSKGDYQGGFKSLGEAIRLEPQNLDLIGRRAAAYVDARQFDNAIADLNRLVAAKPSSVELLSQRCRARAMANKQLDAALSDCQSVVKASGDDDEAIEALAFVYLKMRKFDDAIADYDVVLSRRPNSAIAHFGRGTAELGKRDEAGGKADIAAARASNPNIEADFNGTSSIFPRPAGTTNGQPAVADEDPLRRGELHLEQKDFAGAILDLDQAIRERPTARAYAERSVANYWQGDYDKARSDADKASSLDPKDFVALHGHGLLDSHIGEYQRAVADFSDAISVSPQDAFAYFWRGISYQSLRDFDKALADFDEALRLNSAYDDVYVRRAEIFATKRDGQRALAEVDRFLVAHDTSAYAHGLRGAALRLLGRRDEAANELERSIALKPTVEAYLERAKLRNPVDQAQSFADIDLALKLDPKSVPAYRIRASLLVASNDYVGAASALDEALRIAPDDESVLEQLAEVHARNRQFDLAIAESDRLRNRHPDNATYLNNGCWFRAIGAKELDTALDLCNAALKSKPDVAGFFDSRGLVLLRLGRLEEAIQDYDAALKLQPKLLPSLFGRGIAEQRKGAAEDAKADLAAARAVDAKIDAQFAGYGLAP
jgi:tetratricopeptide (TPR) repeat protein